MVSAPKPYAVTAIKQKIVDSSHEAMADLLTDAMLAWLGPGLSSFVGAAGSTYSQVGAQFEHMTQNLLCEVLPAGALNFEVGIDQGSGVATDDGYGGCPPERRHFGGVKDIRRPDILVNQGSPMAGDQSLLIAEVKRGIGTFYGAWKKKRRGQWLAISKHSKNKGYPPHAVVLIALVGGKGYHEKFLKRILRQGEHYGIILQIL